MTVLRLRAVCRFVGVLFFAGVGARADDVEFNRDIRPILAKNCLLCHGPDASQRKADLRLDVAEIARKSAIRPGKPDQSELIDRITSDDPDLKMPPADSGKELTGDEIALLKQWIREGARYEAHWSFISPQRPLLPRVKTVVRGMTTIDRFLLRKLEEQGLTFAKEASREALIRRASLDLTGLPPSPKEVDAFLRDRSSRAWERAIDRLLASDRYGEHMARFWMDAARYADTNGYQYDLEREQWVWRDWVIHAFNTNMPFDQFTVEQLAGDLLPGATDQQKLATGFHRNHPITIEGGVIDEEYRTEYVIDRVVTTSTVWMGLTMLCGRCHDHKYDPVTQREFYQFFAFFNQVPEKGNGGFTPKLQVASPLQGDEVKRVSDQLAAAEAQFQKLTSGISRQTDDWEKQVTDEVTNQWTIVVPADRRSSGGATLTVQPDQSILAIEALTDKSFLGGRTGRGSNGNFVLSEFQLAASAKGSPETFEAVKIATAQADYSQRNYGIGLAIDGKIDRTGWAVDGNTKFENRVAVFTPSEPIRQAVTSRIRIQMHHRYGGNHHIGRFRLSLAAKPVISVPPDVTAIAQTAAAKRTAQQKTRLLEYLISRFGSEKLRSSLRKVVVLRRQRRELDKTPATMVMADMAQPRKTHILFRGEYDKPREEVSAGTPAALLPMPRGAPKNRLGLARWLTMKQHPLTARVAVNRLWAQIFGTGIVETVQDFGTQGAWPSHPELLDWLAVAFVESGWDMKALLKQILMSKAYRQESRIDPKSRLLSIDPDNRWLGRGPRLRLDAEVIRDSALAASGLLTERLGGPSVFPYHPKGLWQEINNRPGYSRFYTQSKGADLYRRSLYTFWKRTVPPPSMSAFDAPEREFCVVDRSRTNTPLQAIVMLHDPQFVEAARYLGRRILMEAGPSDDERIIYGFRLCTARRPTSAERAILQRILNQRRKQYRADPKAAEKLLTVGDSRVNDNTPLEERAAWTTVGRVLLNLSEFLTKG